MILITTQCFAPEVGGIENLMTGLATALHGGGHEVMVYADRGRRPAAGLPFSVHRYGGPRPWRQRGKARAIHRALRQGAVRAIICDSWKSLERLRPPSGVTVLCLAHGMELPPADDSRKGARVAAALSRANHVIANSNHTAGQARPWLSAGQSLHVIPPGVDLPGAPGPETRRRATALTPDRRPRLISVGRLQEHKGQDTVLACLPDLLREFPELLYLCVGEGPARRDLERRVRELGLEGHVCLPGIADPGVRTALLQDSDVFVLPGRPVDRHIEGFGIAFIEAAWLGLPAVAGSAGGSAEAVLHGETGLVCDGSNRQAVYRAIRSLLLDPALRQHLGERAREHARCFRWEVIVRRYEALL